MNKFTRVAAAFAACAALAQSAYAGDMAVFGDAPFGYNQAGLINVYASAPGDTGTAISTLSAATLSGIELLWLTQPINPYSPAQLSVLATYLAGGGRIAFLGEHGQIAPTENNNISAAIAALGGNISIINNILDPNFRVANRTGAGNGGIILNDPLTAGVNQYEYAAFAQLNLGVGARTLMLGDDGVSVMMAFENIGAGSIFLITDQNPLDVGVINDPAFDNTRMFLNLLQADTGAPPPPVIGVPEPETLALFALGILGLGLARRRKQS